MENNFDVIIIGGSYAGLSAGMSLGRSLRKVLVIDSGKPCNMQTPHSHNFLTHDGKAPKEISSLAKEQVLQYKTVGFQEGFVTEIVKQSENFEVQTESGELFNAKKLILASGVKDMMPDIPGFAECWGISVI
ncbi:NAD(P)/FAD-dependent oxidoreductase, partial [uncultured Chryseobacterium sp.]